MPANRRGEENSSNTQLPTRDFFFLFLPSPCILIKHHGGGGSGPRSGCWGKWLVHPKPEPSFSAAFQEPLAFFFCPYINLYFAFYYPLALTSPLLITSLHLLFSSQFGSMVSVAQREIFFTRCGISKFFLWVCFRGPVTTFQSYSLAQLTTVDEVRDGMIGDANLNSTNYNYKPHTSKKKLVFPSKGQKKKKKFQGI